METENPEVIKALRSRNLLGVEFFDITGDSPELRDRFIVFILKAPETPEGVRLVTSHFDVRYRDSTDWKAEGLERPPAWCRGFELHFEVPVSSYDVHLASFFRRITAKSKVSFIVTVNKIDSYAASHGLARHQLHGIIGNRAWLLYEWVGFPGPDAPVQYPRPGISSAPQAGIINQPAANFRCILPSLFSSYCKN